MKTKLFAKPLLAAVAGLALLAGGVMAQNSTPAAAPQLSYGASQIVQLAQAKVGDDTIIAYIHNSGDGYTLNADQIIYMRQQGVSDNVVNAMLNQPKTASVSAQPAVQPDNSSAAQSSTASAPSATTAYVQTAPPSTVYVIPDTQTYYYDSYYARPYYYPYYAWPYPSVSFSFGFGGGYHGGFHGGGFRGGHR